jgi:tRNA G10  N-methylase Trm11
MFADVPSRFSPPILKLELPEVPNNLIHRLGGTIKITTELPFSCQPQDLADTLFTYLESQSGKVVFGLSYYKSPHITPPSPHELENLGKNVKKRLQAAGRSVRYIPNRETILSSVTVEKNNLPRRGYELCIHNDGSGRLAIAKTSAVQPFEAFSARDFGRPGRDDKSGMLPPKLALMMLNFARVTPQDVVLDPFCGSGTIITEALLMGSTNVIGTDLSEKAVADTLRNVAWIQNRAPQTKNAKVNIFVHDATTLNQTQTPASVDAIVTEPFLGKPLTGREPKPLLEKQRNELVSLYHKTLTTCYTLLKPGGTLVMIVPRFRSGPTWITLPFADAVTASGFTVDPLTLEHPVLVYARATQHVGREIWRLHKN